MIKQWRLATVISLVLLLLATMACVAVSKTAERAPAAMPPMSPPLANKSMVISTDSYNSSEGGGTGTVDHKIVRTGSFTLEVRDIGKAQDDVTALASQLNGFVVSSNQRGDDDNPSGFISIRVPADRFTEATQKIKAMALKVVYETTNSQDVSEQYADLKAQLKNLEATEQQFLDLMKKAENVKDILEVQRELSRVRGEIERVKGRILYLDRTSDMSLIDVTLQKTKPIGESKWDVLGILKSAVDGLMLVGQFLVGLVIWLLVFSPVWIIILVIIWLVRRRKKAKAPPA